jgi:hypothetical protein
MGAKSAHRSPLTRALLVCPCSVMDLERLTSAKEIENMHMPAFMAGFRLLL